MSVKDAKLAFLDAMKKKYNIKFRIDEEGDLYAQNRQYKLASTRTYSVQTNGKCKKSIHRPNNQ
ncbi:hypothetical protein [Borreliella valaisiana]|uniref:hypothetical protein n=1 Tax=Borreliella valaisiana TaxID=62088 RepID=UPI003BA15C0E